MSNTRVLLIACYFPPTGGVQVQRALSLAKYLPQCGIDLHVLTTSNPSVPTFDPGLLKQIPSEVKIHRALTLEPPFHLRKKIWGRLKSSSVKSGTQTSRKPGFLGRLKRGAGEAIARLLCPDPQVLWYPMALRKADKIVRQHQIEAVLVTAPPFSALLLGNELKRRYPHLRLITDIRDEWITYFAQTFAFAGNPYVMNRATVIERETVELSDCIVPVTAASQSEIRSRYPDQPAGKFRVVPNGFDPASFSKFQPRPNNTGKIVITYTGTLYSPASPAAFLDVLEQMPEDIRSRFELRFIGRMAEEFDASIFINRKCDIRQIGFVRQAEAFRYLEESDYVLLPWSDHLNVPGKLYEYLATRKPVIAIAQSHTDVARIIRRTGSGWCIDPSDTMALQSLLLRLVQGSAAEELTINNEEIRRYERPRLAADYARLIQECVSGVPNNVPREDRVASLSR